MDHLLYRKSDAAARLGIGLRKLEYLIADGEIETVAIGKRGVRIPAQSLEAFVKRLRKRGMQATEARLEGAAR